MSHRRADALRRMVSILLIGTLLLAGCERENASSIGASNSAPSAPQRAIDFTLPDLAGRPHTLAEYLNRGPVMLVFFTTWCPYCRKEIPALKQAYAEHGVKGLNVVAINAGLADSLENARAYALEHRLPYPVLYDADATVSSRYGVKVVPRVYLIRQDGRIVAVTMRVPYDKLRKLLGIDQDNAQAADIRSGDGED